MRMTLRVRSMLVKVYQRYQIRSVITFTTRYDMHKLIILATMPIATTLRISSHDADSAVMNRENARLLEMHQIACP